MKVSKTKIGYFVGGLVFGTAGLAILASKEAKKVYTVCTAAALRAKDCVLDKVAEVQSGAGDVVAEAKEVNERKAAEKAARLHTKEETTEAAE
ncbi:DUF6110 family protein [Pseudoramibacter sp. HA2172]|uniref:DUF6110 family protein n=1 Tax=Pseudoramibacter faecis TaxID=3108534 RepID=UPI002E799D0B|nr:DUF6110 family protein [Pseudoramibacter sp. HA2172]